MKNQGKRRPPNPLTTQRLIPSPETEGETAKELKNQMVKMFETIKEAYEQIHKMLIKFK